MQQLAKEPEVIDASGSTPSRGVRPLNERARRIERRVTLTTVLIPYIGLGGGILLFWNRGVNLLDLTVFGIMYMVTVLGIGESRRSYHPALDRSPPLSKTAGEGRTAVRGAPLTRELWLESPRGSLRCGRSWAGR